MGLFRRFTLSQAWRETLSQPLRILLVEDDGELRGWMAEALRGAHFEVLEASDGRFGLEALYQGLAAPSPSSFDIVIADYRMPRLTGLSLLGRLRSEGMEIPFILMTAFRTAAIQDEAALLGACAVLQKPVDFDALQVAVCDAV